MKAVVLSVVIVSAMLWMTSRWEACQDRGGTYHIWNGCTEVPLDDLSAKQRRYLRSKEHFNP